MPRRQPFMTPGQPREASVTGDGEGAAGMPMVPQGGRVGVRPASPMGGIGGGADAGTDPVIAAQLQGILGDNPMAHAGGPMAPMNVGPMLQPARANTQFEGTGGNAAPTMAAPVQPMSATPLPPWGQGAGMQQPPQPGAAAGAAIGLPAGYGDDMMEAGAEAGTPQVPLTMLKLLKAMGH